MSPVMMRNISCPLSSEVFARVTVKSAGVYPDEEVTLTCRRADGSEIVQSVDRHGSSYACVCDDSTETRAYTVDGRAVIICAYMFVDDDRDVICRFEHRSEPEDKVGD